MIKIGDRRKVILYHNANGSLGLKVMATCIEIYPKKHYNMCLFKTDKGTRTIEYDYERE